MPAGGFQLFALAKRDMLRGLIDLDTDTFVCVLLTSSYTPQVNTHAVFSDISGNEVANGNGYTTGGQVISPLTVTHSSGVVTVDSATNPSWNNAAITAKYAAVVKRAGGSLVAGDLLLGYCDLDTGGGSVSVSNNGLLEITWNTSGFFTI